MRHRVLRTLFVENLGSSDSCLRLEMIQNLFFKFLFSLLVEKQSSIS